MEKVLKDNVNQVLKGNNIVVDNELGGTDVTLKIQKGYFKWRNRKGFLKMEDK